MPKTNSPALNSLQPSDDSRDDETHPIAVVPTAKDVLFGRGKTNFNHPGNSRFRSTVGSRLEEYACADSRGQKSRIVRAIADEVLKEDARFLRQNPDTFIWHEESITAARAKVSCVVRDQSFLKAHYSNLHKCIKIGHALRDALSDKSRSINKIRLDLLRQNANDKRSRTKKRKNVVPEPSLIEASKATLGDSMDGMIVGTDGFNLPKTLDLQSVFASNGINDDFIMNDALARNFLALDETDISAERFLADDPVLSDDLLSELAGLKPSESPDSSCGSLAEYLDVVNGIEIEELEAYLTGTLGCTQEKI